MKSILMMAQETTYASPLVRKFVSRVGKYSREAKAKRPPVEGGLLTIQGEASYKVDSISKPQASSNGSGMYLEFLLRRAHSRNRVERKYWSGVSLYSFTTCSNSVTVGTTGPIGSGLPQFGL